VRADNRTAQTEAPQQKRRANRLKGAKNAKHNDFDFKQSVRLPADAKRLKNPQQPKAALWVSGDWGLATNKQTDGLGPGSHCLPHLLD